MEVNWVCLFIHSQTKVVWKFPHILRQHPAHTVHHHLHKHRKITKTKHFSFLSLSLSIYLSLSSTHWIWEPPRTFRTLRAVDRFTSKMLPYGTLEEASAALGRNLTMAETVWFNYSAGKSDYYLYCHNIFFLFFVFSVAPLPLVFVELARLAGFDRYKIQPKVRLSGSEIGRCYKDVMRMFFFIVGPLQLVSYPSVQVLYLWMRFGFGFGVFGVKD